MKDARNPQEILGGRVFVGRDAELAELKTGFEDALSDQSRLFLISGEPGIGKTRLAEEIASYAVSRQAHVAWGRCWSGGGAPAYWPWIQIIRSCLRNVSAETLSLGAAAVEIARIVPEFGPVNSRVVDATVSRDDPEQAQFRLFESILHLLEEIARRRPLLMILDDLHDSDRVSLLLLRFAARELRSFRGMFVGTYRDREVSRSDVLSPIMAEVAREGSELILAGLREEDIARIIERGAGMRPGPALINNLHHTTGGNPLFLERVVRIVVAEGKEHAIQRLESGRLRIPTGLRDSIQRSLGTLPRETHGVLGVAAVIGNEFDLKVLGAVSGFQNEDLLDRLARAASDGIIVETGRIAPRYRFSHALIRGVLYEELPVSERGRLHARIGDELERLYRNSIEDRLGELAYHFLRAAPLESSEKAFNYSVRAGDAAFKLFAYDEAASHWRSALDLLQANAADAPARATLLERLGEATIATDVARGIEHLEQALLLYESCGRKDRVGELHARIGSALSIRSVIWNIPKAFEHLRKAEALLSEGPETEALGHLFVGLAQAAEHIVDIDQGLRASRRAMEIGQRLSNDRIWTNAAVQHGTYLMRRGRLADAKTLLDQAWERADRLDDGFSAAWYGGYYRLALWDGKEAEMWYRRELAKPRTAHAHFLREVLSNALAIALLLSGEIEEARQLVVNATVGLGKGLVCRFDGDWEQAESLFTYGLEQSRRAGTRDDEFNFLHCLGALFHERGQNREAESLLREAVEICPDGLHWQMAIRPYIALVYADMGRLEDARPHVDYCKKVLSDGEDWRVLAGHAAHAEAVICAADGRHGEAEDLFRKAVSVFRQYHVPWTEAEVYLYWGLHLRASNQIQAAIDKFDAALCVYERIGASARWVARVNSEKERTTGLASTVPGFTARSERPASGSLSDEVVLRKEGEYWTIIRGNKVLRLKAVKGLSLISTLVRYPNREFHVLDLEAGEAGGASLDGSEGKLADAEVSADLMVRMRGEDAGEILDDKAKNTYRHAILELKEELELAKQAGQETRAEEIEEEIDALVRQLREGFGLYGRARRAASTTERARLNVSRAIRAAIEKVSEGDLEFSKLLGSTIRTGTFCSYVPDPENPISWKL